VALRGALLSCLVNRLAETVIVSLSFPVRLLVTGFAAAWVGCVVLILAHTVLPGRWHYHAVGLPTALRAAGFAVLAAALPLNVFLDTRVPVPVGITDLVVVLLVTLPWFAVAAAVDR